MFFLIQFGERERERQREKETEGDREREKERERERGRERGGEREERETREMREREREREREITETYRSTVLYYSYNNAEVNNLNQFHVVFLPIKKKKLRKKIIIICGPRSDLCVVLFALICEAAHSRCCEMF